MAERRRFLMRADRAREAGQWQVAAGLYRIALDRTPDNPPIWIQYGHALKELGNRAALFCSNSTSAILSSVIGSSVVAGGLRKSTLAHLPDDHLSLTRAPGSHVMGHYARRALTAEFPPRARTLTAYVTRDLEATRRFYLVRV